jgi:hypothetical protein
MIRRIAAGYAALALLLTLGAGSVLAQERVRIREVSALGDVSEVEDTTDMSLTVRVTVDGQEAPRAEFVKREREKYVETVLGTASGRKARARRTYSISRAAESGPEGKLKQRVSTVQGKTVTVRLVNGQATVTPSRGRIAPQDAAALKSDFSRAAGSVFPDRELSVGEEWSVDPNALSAVFGEVDRAEVRGRFEEITEHGGYRCARMRLDVTVEGKASGSPFPITMKLAGQRFYALDLNRPIELDMSGPITLNGETKEGGRTIVLAGEGTFKARQTARWLKVAGKPPAPRH